jgi:hypothetical protein
MSETGSEFSEHKVDWRLKFAKFEVTAAFVQWLWCQERLNALVNSYDRNSSRAWLAMFAERRRAARNSQFKWVSALYAFRRLIEEKGQDSAQGEC